MAFHDMYTCEKIKLMCMFLFAAERISINAIPLKGLIPAKLTTYYRYEGSLTTPPCYESVTWSLFHENIEIAEEQVYCIDKLCIYVFVSCTCSTTPGKLSQVPPRRYRLNDCDRYPELPVMVKN